MKFDFTELMEINSGLANDQQPDYYVKITRFKQVSKLTLSNDLYKALDLPEYLQIAIKDNRIFIGSQLAQQKKYPVILGYEIMICNRELIDSLVAKFQLETGTVCFSDIRIEKYEVYEESSTTKLSIKGTSSKKQEETTIFLRQVDQQKSTEKLDQQLLTNKQAVQEKTMSNLFLAIINVD